MVYLRFSTFCRWTAPTARHHPWGASEGKDRSDREVMKYTTIVAALLACVLLTNGTLYSVDGGAPTYTLHSSREAGQIDQVNTVVEVTGNLFGKDDPKRVKRPRRPAMSLVCKRDLRRKDAGGARRNRQTLAFGSVLQPGGRHPQSGRFRYPTGLTARAMPDRSGGHPF